MGSSSTISSKPITNALPTSGGNESESDSASSFSRTTLNVPGVSATQSGKPRGAIVANRGDTPISLTSRASCPSPSSISTAPSRIATRCFRWCCVCSRAARWRLLRLAGPDARRRFASRSITTAARSSNPCCARRCAACRAPNSHASREPFVRDTIAQRCFADALATIRRHRDAGHYLVLMSASVDFYVPEFGRQLGFDQVISTGVRWNGDRLDGTLTTANRRGEEKARCLRELLAQRQRLAKPSPTATAIPICRICKIVAARTAREWLIAGAPRRPRRSASPPPSGPDPRPGSGLRACDARHTYRCGSAPHGGIRGRRIGRQSHSVAGTRNLR